MENLAITKTNDLPIRHEGEVHNGKVRSVYWLKKEDSERIAKDYGLRNRDLGVITDTSSLYSTLAEQITGKPIMEIGDVRTEIIKALKPYDLIEE